MANEIKLREAFNKVDVVGVLAEKNLEVKVFNGKEAIVGDLVIKTAPTSFIKLKVFTNRLKSDGTESKAFTAFSTVMNEYKSIAETGNEDLADKVSAFGKISEGKPFTSQQGDVIVPLSNQISFVSRVTDMSKYVPMAKWQGEVFVQGYKVEKKKEDDEWVETGRKLMDVVVPVYGGKAFPMTLVLSEDGADWFEDNVEKNRTVKVYCDLFNSTEKIVQGSTSGGFGQRDPQVFTRIVNERIVVGADDAYPEYEDGEESQKAYNPTVITQALAVREQVIEEAKNGGSTAQAPTRTFGSATPTPTTTPTTVPPTEDEDIPF